MPRADRAAPWYGRAAGQALAWFALSVTSAGLAGAQQTVPYQRDSLPNGLQIIFSEDHSTPIVTIDVWYAVGSRNETMHHSGFAHLFEHMMFQGSAHVAKGEHSQLIERAGGTDNGTTNEDRTAYYETLPANRLNLGLWLEADRMRSLAVTEENFENQRQAVKEERRLRVDNQPYAPAFSEGLTLLFDSTACFPYAHTVIGSMTDLDSAKVQEVQAFFDLYYTPNNATLTVTGDFDRAATLALIRRYFGDIPRGRMPPGVQCQSRFDVGARHRVWQDAHANLPAVAVAYRVPPHRDPDTPALALLASVLGSGESSRLNLTLVREKRTALGAGVQTTSRLGPGYFAMFAISNQGVPADTLEQQIDSLIAGVREKPVTAAELEKVKSEFKAGNIFGRQTTMAIAERLQHYAHYHSSLADMATDLDRYMAVTADDLQRVARKYLVPANRLTIVVVPKAAAQP